MSPQNLLEPKKIENTSLGYRIFCYDSLPSTNDWAKRVAQRSKEERIVILAETQTSGKGRLKRYWVSPKGGVWLSIILRPKMPPQGVLKLTFIASLAVANTINEMFHLKTEVKWPNDVLVNGKKVCGILTEANIRKNAVEFVVLGVGINANIKLESFPCDLQNTATSLKHELCNTIDLRPFIKKFLRYFDRYYKRLQQGLWRMLLQEWKCLASFLGKQVEINIDSAILVGKAWDITEDCALILRLDDGILKKILTGDVKLCVRKS
ncbi:MAG: biotin--[acetyl-CoA-carboxylase] ligase [Candidatus Bathyarchaeota archaeon]|nr:MAG: biotin--[acetyl-CoA-carboxylase] ligase [Candidatus Bathyarchaeota archaeon]